MCLHNCIHECSDPSIDYILVPRPFQALDFDHLQYAKIEGESLGDLVMCTVV